MDDTGNSALNIKNREMRKTRFIELVECEWAHKIIYMYEGNFSSEDTVLQGSTALPAGSDVVYDILCYWLECLTELTRYLQGCQWHVNLDDMDLTWDEDSGWLPDI